MDCCQHAPRYEVTLTYRQDEAGHLAAVYGLRGRRRDFFGGPDRTREMDVISHDEGIVADMANLFNQVCLPLECLRLAVWDLMCEEYGAGLPELLGAMS